LKSFNHLREDASEWWRVFWDQPNKTYRNFQIVFFLLGVHFLIPSFTYAFSPDSAISQLSFAGNFLGSGPYKYSEDGFVWRILGAGNVFTLAFMCFLIQSNVRRFYPVLIPLCVLKSYASIGFLITYLFAYKYAVFFGVFLWDASNVLMFLYFAHTAYHSIDDYGKESAVPRLMFDK
jgi:hypothetical protein